MTDVVSDPLLEKKKESIAIIESIMNIPNNDNITSIRQLILYLNKLLRIRTIVPPISEIMIVLRVKKPILYHSTRFKMSKNSHLHMLFTITGDPDVADQRLESYLSEE